MNFIFPKNYNFSFKLFGFIDYSTVIINIIYGLFIFVIINLLVSTISMKIYLFIILFLPFFLFTALNIHRENIFIIFLYLIKYMKRQKIYFYNKL